MTMPTMRRALMLLALASVVHAACPENDPSETCADEKTPDTSTLLQGAVGVQRVLSDVARAEDVMDDEEIVVQELKERMEQEKEDQVRKRSGKNIVILGDSMAEYSGTALAHFCKGATVHNAGIGGSTADEWSTKSIADVINTTKCSGIGKPDFIWLSIGGNDNFHGKCALTSAELAAKITATIDQIRAQAPGVKILMVGYPMPKGRGMEGCNKPQKFVALSEALQIATADYSKVYYVDSEEVAGGSSTKWSDYEYFQDAIHLNNKGYCKVFSQTAVQQLLGCEDEVYDCDSETCDLPGLDLHCGRHGARATCPCCSAYCDGADEGKACNTEYKKNKDNPDWCWNCE